MMKSYTISYEVRVCIILQKGYLEKKNKRIETLKQQQMKLWITIEPCVIN